MKLPLHGRTLFRLALPLVLLLGAGATLSACHGHRHHGPRVGPVHSHRHYHPATGVRHRHPHRHPHGRHRH